MLQFLKNVNNLKNNSPKKIWVTPFRIRYYFLPVRNSIKRHLLCADKNVETLEICCNANRSIKPCASLSFRIDFVSKYGDVSTSTHCAKVNWVPMRNESWPCTTWKGHSKTEAITCLLNTIWLFIPLSETEYNGGLLDYYNGSSQDTIASATDKGHPIVMSKINCPITLLDASFTSREYRQS